MQRAVMRLTLSMLLLASVAVAGCGARANSVQGPVVVSPALCPEPPAPDLPQIDAAQPLDAWDNVRALRLRDVVTRGYMAALRRAVRCYAAQTQTEQARGD